MAPKIPTDLDFISDFGSREILAKVIKRRRRHRSEIIIGGEAEELFFDLWFSI